VDKKARCLCHFSAVSLSLLREWWLFVERGGAVEINSPPESSTTSFAAQMMPKDSILLR
jgi:hypothetical protein